MPVCVWVCWQSCIRTPRTHSAEGRVPGAGCGVYASTPTHFLSHCAHSDFASPSQQSRETPFCQCVDEIQRNQALCKTRLSLAQTQTVLAAGTGLEAFPRGLNCDEKWTSLGDKVLDTGCVGKMQDRRFVSEGPGLKPPPESGFFSAPLARPGSSIFSAVQQQDYSAMIWLKRRDRMERVRLTFNDWPLILTVTADRCPFPLSTETIHL